MKKDRKEYHREWRRKKGIPVHEGKQGVVGKKPFAPEEETETLSLSLNSQTIKNLGGREIVRKKLIKSFKGYKNGL